MPIVPINALVRQVQGAGDDPDPARAGPDRLPARRRHRPATPPTSPPATRWSTAAGPSTSWSPSGPTPRRSRSSTTSRRPCRACRRSCPTTSRSASSSTSRPTVTSVDVERGDRRACWAPCLTGLMVLLFLRDWRSVIVVVLNIPFALLRRAGGAVADRADDQPDDPGRAGAGRRHPGGRGDRRGREHPPPDGADAARSPGRCGGATARRPCRGCWRCSASWRCSSRRSSCRGRPGAVRAAVAGRRLRHGHLVPAVQHVRAGAVDLAAAPPSPPAARRRGGDRSSSGSATAYGRAVGGVVRLALAGRAGLPRRARRRDRARSGRPLGLEIFPAGRRRPVPAPPAGARRHADRGDRAARHRSARRRSRRRSAADNVAISVGYVGLIPSSYPINAIYQWTGGPEEAILRVALKHGREGRHRAAQGAAPRRARRRRCPACGSRSSRPTSSAR